MRKTWMLLIAGVLVHSLCIVAEESALYQETADLVFELPNILVQPRAQSVTAGENVIIAVSAAGYPTPSYQWRRNGEHLTDETRPTLYLADVSTNAAGIYDVVARNKAGTVVSTVAELLVGKEDNSKTHVVKPGDNLYEISKKLLPGDTMLFREGIYYLEECGKIFPIAQSPDKPITFAACPGEKPIIDGTMVLKGEWQKHKAAIYSLDLAAAGYEKPEGLRFRHSTKGYPVMCRYMEILWQDGHPGTGIPLVHQMGLTKGRAENLYEKQWIQSWFKNREHLLQVDRPGEFAYDPLEHKLYVWMHTGDDPNKHVIRAQYGRSRALMDLAGNQYYIVRGLNLRGCSGSAIYSKAKKLVIEDTEMSYMSGQLFRQHVADDEDNFVVIRNCNIHHGYYNAAQGMPGGLFLFEGNEVHHMGAPDTWPHEIIGAETGGLNLSHGHHHIIRSNYFHDIIHGARMMNGHGVMHETWGEKENEPHNARTHHGVYENNLFVNCGLGLAFPAQDTTHHHVIRNNVFLNCRRNAISLKGDNRSHLIAGNAFGKSGLAFIGMSESERSRFKKRGFPIYCPLGNVIQDNVFSGKELTTFWGKTREADNIFRANTRIQKKECSLEDLMQALKSRGADFSGVPDWAAGAGDTYASP